MNDREMNAKQPENTPEKRPLSTSDIAGTSPIEHRDVQSPAMRATGSSGQNVALFNPDEMKALHDRWLDVQSGFVDEPRHAVEEGDHLVAEVIQKLAQSFSKERGNLEHQWNQGADVSTEDLRLALQRYRSFFDRLLSL